jgi:hypothetical protein
MRLLLLKKLTCKERNRRRSFPFRLTFGIEAGWFGQVAQSGKAGLCGWSGCWAIKEKIALFFVNLSSWKPGTVLFRGTVLFLLSGSVPNGDSLRAEASKTGTVPGPIGGCPRLLRVEATAVAKCLKLRLLRCLTPWLHQTRKLGTAPDKAGDSPKFSPCGCKKCLN